MAIFGAVVDALRKNRWDLIFVGTMVVFIGLMSLSDRRNLSATCS
jgi:hypothetical protein